ncbi:MAG: sulfotransferase [Phycisphaerae bacterium]|nr:sulfotransferase [Phycisphaerae bacterium]MBT6165706.1 sulfotransferase [Phycisphaerae bacterium]MBT7658496.1 sulfotransferase [Phycisphaerae bacterium]
MLQNILQKLLPYPRAVKYARLLRRSQRDAKSTLAQPLEKPVSFVFGCGRSGTTILGILLTQHKQVHYLREPYHIWRAIEPSTDMVRLFGDAGVDPHCILSNESATPEVIQRFKACMQAEQTRGGSSAYVIEKTPIQAMRIELLYACSPQSRFIHLVRNGLDVVRSIDKLAKDNSYGIAGKGTWNRWWGRDMCKWHALAADAIEHNWFASEVPLLSTDAQMGALEWIVSLSEVQKHKKLLGDSLLEITYNDFTGSSANTVEEICRHFGLDVYDEWVDICCNTLEPARKNSGSPLVLPPEMCSTFNQLQAHYGFEGTAVEQ